MENSPHVRGGTRWLIATVGCIYYTLNPTITVGLRIIPTVQEAQSKQTRMDRPNNNRFGSLVLYTLFEKLETNPKNFQLFHLRKETFDHVLMMLSKNQETRHSDESSCSTRGNISCYS